MSEEEIIKKANAIIENHREIDKMMVIEMVELIQGLLDLYEQEKEKNEFIMTENLNDKYEEVLEKTFKKYIDTKLEKDFISKDKLSDIILSNVDNRAIEKIKAMIF